MASRLEFAEYICEQLEGVGTVRARKMFGEYMIYLNDKPVILICDDTIFIKRLPCLAQLLSGNDCGTPYEGAKEHYILDPDDRETLRRAAVLVEEVTPVPRKRTGKAG